MRQIVNSQASLSKAIGLLRKTFEEKKYLTVTVRIGKDRTLPLNALSHAWYKQISDERQEHTPGEVKNLCKWHYGMPILLGDDVEVEYRGKMVPLVEVYEAFLKPLPYEHQTGAMSFFPVTSLMTTKQFIKYLETVQRMAAKRGVMLEWPDEER